MDLLDFWVCFFEKPETLSYYDRQADIENTITNMDDMTSFVDANWKRKVSDFNYYRTANKLFIEIK